MKGSSEIVKRNVQNVVMSDNTFEKNKYSRKIWTLRRGSLQRTVKSQEDTLCSICNHKFASEQLLHTHVVETHSNIKSKRSNAIDRSSLSMRKENKTASISSKGCKEEIADGIGSAFLIDSNRCASPQTTLAELPQKNTRKGMEFTDCSDKRKTVVPNAVEKVHDETHYVIDILPDTNQEHLQNVEVLPLKCGCRLCNKVMNNQDDLERHLKLCCTEFSVICKVCKMSFKTDEDLKHHEKKSHKISRCTECSVEFESVVNLQRHMRSHDRNIYRCEFCTVVFKFKKSYLKHLTLHNNSVGFNCEQCGKTLKTSETYKLHILQHLPEDEKPYHCDVCNKGFATLKHLKSHNAVHGNGKTFICEICGKCFRKNRTLQAHRCLHTGELPYKCQHCNKGFRSWSSLDVHKKVHIKPKSLMCDLCGKCFTLKTNLKRHLLSHSHSRKLQCEICEKVMKTSEGLKSHHVTFHSSQSRSLHSGRVNSCDVCGKLFRDSNKLTRHKRIHTGERPFACQYCNKTFNDKCNLKSHTKIHTNDRQYRCDVCNKGFIHQRTLEKHIKKHS